MFWITLILESSAYINQYVGINPDKSLSNFRFENIELENEAIFILLFF